MRRLTLVCLLALAGCTGQTPVYDLPVIAPMAPSTSQGRPTWYSEGKGSLPVIYWKGTVSNLTGKQSKFLVIDCLDQNGKVLARDQIKCIMDAGKTLEMSNSMNVPAEIVFKISSLLLTLTDGKSEVN